jgi:hypothetical protein
MRMVPTATPVAKARIIQRRCLTTSPRRIARTASSRQIRNQQPKMAVAMASAVPPRGNRSPKMSAKTTLSSAAATSTRPSRRCRFTTECCIAHRFAPSHVTRCPW